MKMDAKFTFLSVLAILNLIGCAQRLERNFQANSGLGPDTRFSDNTTAQLTNPKVNPSVVVNPDRGTTPQGSQIPAEEKSQPVKPIESQLPVETVRAAAPVSTSPEPHAPVLSIPGVPTNETPVACGIEFQAVEESLGAQIMKPVTGFWVEDGLSAVRSIKNVAVSADTRPALGLGAKNDEIFVAKATFKPTEKMTPGTSPFEVSSVERKGRAFSYIVGPEVNGFRLIQISLIGDKSSKMSCITFGLRLDSTSTDTLLVAGPLKSIDSLKSTEEDVQVRSYKRHALKGN